MPRADQIRYSTLEKISKKEIYECAATIFNDLKINGKTDDGDYEKRLIDGNYSESFSYGAFLNGKLVGIVLVGINNYLNKTTAYNIITGVFPELRDRKVASSMMKNVIESLKLKKVESFCLEVMCKNSSAIRTYQKFGFNTTRTLMSFFGKNEKYHESNVKELSINKFDFSKIKKLKTFTPTFNNSFFSMMLREKDLVVYYTGREKNITSLIVVDNKNNTVRYYADNEKRSNIEKLIKHLLCLRKNLFFKDIDNKDKDLIKILNRLNFHNVSNQYEMFLNIT